MSSNAARSRIAPEMPTGTEVAAYKKYEEATQAVDVLSDGGFPLDAVTIVGSDLHLVERIVGKLTPARVAVSGGSQGLTWGLLMGLFALVLVPEAGFLFAMIAISVGILGGVLLGAISWGLTRKRRSFASQNSVVAARYAILVSQEPQKAFGLLANTPGNISHAVRKPARTAEAERLALRRERELAGPPQFGVRLSDTTARSGESARGDSTQSVSPAGAESSVTGSEEESKTGE